MSVPSDSSTTTEEASGAATAAAEPAPASSQPAAAAAPIESAPPTIGNDRNIVLPKDAFNARLKAATEKGRKAVTADLDAKIRAAGLSSFDEMLQVVAKAKADADKPAAAPEASAQTSAKGSDKRMAKELERTKASYEQERKARIKAERNGKQWEDSYNALKAEMAIREVAIMSGVKDVDYAVELLQRSLKGKTEAEMRTVDENKFFEELREKQPYLFGETVRPVTTGTGGKDQPSAPSPGTVHKSSAANGQTDAKKMSRQEYDAHLQKMGLRPPSHIV